MIKNLIDTLKRLLELNIPCKSFKVYWSPAEIFGLACALFFIVSSIVQENPSNWTLFFAGVGASDILSVIVQKMNQKK